MAKTKLAAPTLEYLLALRRELEQTYADQDAQIDRMRQVRMLERPVPLEDRYRFVDVEVRDPIIADETQRVVAALSLNPPKIQVTPARPGETAQTNATLREHWSEETLKIAGSRLPGMPTFRALVDAVAGDGGGWTKLLFDNDVWEHRYSLQEDDAQAYDQKTEDAKKAAGPPFSWISVDVRTVYPVWSGGRLREVLEVNERPLMETLRRYNLGLSKKGGLCSEELGVPLTKVEAARVPHHVTFLEHWDETTCTYVILLAGKNGSGVAGDGSRIVQQFPHELRRPPYFFAAGFMMNQWRNRKVGWSVGESKRWLVEYLSYLRTIYANVAARDAMPPIFRERPDSPEALALYGQTGAPADTEIWDLRQIINGKPGEKLVPFQFPVSQALEHHIAQVEQQVEALLTPRVHGNVGSGLEGAGFAISQVIAETRILQDPLAQSISNSLAEVTRFLWQVARDVVRETIWVRSNGAKDGWLKAEPATDLTDSVGLEWQLDPERPSGKLIDERYWGERIQQKTASIDQAIEAMGDNPDEVRLGIELDRIRQTPWYQQQLDQLVAQQAGRGDLIQQAAQAQQQAQQGQLPGQPPQVSGGMGNGIVPDMGNLAVAPGGGGASGPGPQPAPMQSLGGVPPQQAAAAQAQGMQGR